jgi:DUF971 family protein/molybdopterin converting factor small subunit
MNEHALPIPTEINLHRKTRLLSIDFSDGQHFDLPCEYLRINSHAAEVKAMGQPVTGKETVNIEVIEPQGHYAVRLVFDDGHDTGIYSWETLYQLGKDYSKNWQIYLDQLKAMGYERNADLVAANQTQTIKIIYFSYLVSKLRKETETVRLPASVTNVETLLQWLQRKWSDRGYLVAADKVRVTVNRQFAEPFTRIDEGDEVSITPNSPNPPAPPQ